MTSFAIFPRVLVWWQTLPSMWNSIFKLRLPAMPVRSLFLAGTALTLSLGISPVRGDLIPADRLTDWTPGVKTGVPGGIPTNRTHLIDVTMAPYNADKTGRTDCSAAFNAALAASTDGDVIYFPAGTFRFDNSFGTGMLIHNRTIRGAGMDVTFIDSHSTSNAGITIGTGSSFNYPERNNIVTAGLTKGSTTLTIGDTSAFAVGQLVKIDFENETDDSRIRAGAVPVVSVNNFQYMRRQLAQVTGKTATTLSIFPGIHHSPSPGRSARITQSIFYTTGMGLEDFTLLNINSSATFSIMFQDSIGCWIKNVKSKNTSNYHLTFSACLQSEVRGCHFTDRKSAGSNGSGIMFLTSSGCLVEDNIVDNVAPTIEVNHGSTGNVFAYNLFERSGMNTNHGPHNSHNLYEGNISMWFQSDGYFGSNSEDTYYRNWFTGTTYADRNVQTFVISLNRFSRNISLIGNFFGTAAWPHGSTPYSFGNPNMGNSSYTGTSQMSRGNFPADWKMTATLSKRTSNTSGEITLNGGSLHVGQFRSYMSHGAGELLVSAVSGNVVTISTTGGTLPAQGTAVEIYAGLEGFQELDLDVAATTILKANYHMFANGGLGVPSDQGIGSESFPASRFRSAKPAFFASDQSWPPLNSMLPNPAPSYDSIPAGRRFINGTVPAPGSVGSTAQQAPSLVRIIRQ